ncbi:GGDEF domain-containing protein [Sulfurimonas sp.]|uniref:GGDEF domain-containing protein n=1 Tax=Sulfurimonas sp. TaxID=2022749 RepID=UPI002AB2F4DC|nr:GGDEF domain-containing protein [Sulfurimonas sp.]
MKLILNTTEALIYVIDLENNEIIYANTKCIEEFGNVIGKTCYKVLQKDKECLCEFCPLAEIENPLEYLLETIFEWENKNSLNNKHYLFKDRIILWENNKKVQLKTAIDITKQKKIEEKILELAHYDELTKLPNRVLFKEYLQRAMKRSGRTSEYNALLFIDLDNFKIINDTLGHTIGDKVLVEVAQRIKNSVRENDIVGRIGGDEFVVLIDINEKNIKLIEEKLIAITEKILYSVKSAYGVIKNDLRISASIGIKFFNNDDFSIVELMEHADIAMYKAKLNGKNTFCFSSHF